MTEAQVKLAAKNRLADLEKKNEKWDKATEKELIALFMQDYLDKYGPFKKGKSSKSGTDADTVGLKSGFASSGAALIDTAISHLEDARRANDSIPERLEESYRRVLQETSEVFSFILDPYDVEEEAHRLGLQPELQMDRAAISRVSAEIRKEIEELQQLKATLQAVSSRRKQLDHQQATKFRV